jgi:hypothetical protein
MLIYIEYLNKDKQYKPDTKTFLSYNSALSWGKKQIDNFNPDMIKIKFI